MHCKFLWFCVKNVIINCFGISLPGSATSTKIKFNLVLADRWTDRILDYLKVVNEMNGLEKWEKWYDSYSAQLCKQFRILFHNCDMRHFCNKMTLSKPQNAHILPVFSESAGCLADNKRKIYLHDTEWIGLVKRPHWRMQENIKLFELQCVKSIV